MENRVEKYERARQARWDRENLVTISTHIRRDLLQDWKMACLLEGRSPYAVLRDFVLQFIDDHLGGPPPAVLA